MKPRVKVKPLVRFSISYCDIGVLIGRKRTEADEDTMDEDEEEDEEDEGDEEGADGEFG